MTRPEFGPSGAFHDVPYGNAKLAASEREELRSRHAAGETRFNLAREYGISIATVHGICKGIDHRPRHNLDQLRADVAVGKPCRHIAMDHERGVSVKLMAQLCSRERTKVRVDRNAKMRAAALDGTPRPTIANQFGVSLGTVNLVCKSIDTRNKLSLDQRAQMRLKAMAGANRFNLAQEYNVSMFTVHAICRGIDYRAQLRTEALRTKHEAAILREFETRSRKLSP